MGLCRLESGIYAVYRKGLPVLQIPYGAEGDPGTGESQQRNQRESYKVFDLWIYGFDEWRNEKTETNQHQG